MPFLEAVSRLNEIYQPIMIDIEQMRDTKSWSNMIYEAIEYDVSEMEEGLTIFFEKYSLKSLHQDIGVLSDDNVTILVYILQFVSNQER